MTIVLASRSPRRVDLLSSLGIDPIVDPADIDETPQPGESARSYVERLACQKAAVVALRHDVATCHIVGADTTIEIDVEIFGQPSNRDHAAQMLKRLSARTHHVHTGVCVVVQGVPRSFVVTTAVTFVPVTDSLLEWYLETQEWQGKAGAYAIQGMGATLVEHVRGSYSNVVGLPLRETASVLGIGLPAELAESG